MADILARDLIIDVNSAGQTVGAGAGGTPPPAFCDVLEMELVVEGDATGSQDGDEYTATGTASEAQGSAIFVSRYAYGDFFTAPPYVELRALPGYTPNSGLFVSFGPGALGVALAGGLGAAVMPNTAGANTGSIIRLSDGMAVASGLDIPAEAVIQVRLDLDAGELIAVDEDENVYTVEVFPPQFEDFAGLPSWYVWGCQVFDLGDTITGRFNAGSSEPLIDTDGALGWCSFTEGVPYVFWTLFTSGDANNLDDLRIAVNTKDGASTPRYTGTMAYPALTPVGQFSGELYECEVLRNDDDDTIYFLRVGVDAFLTSQLTLDYDQNDRLEIFSQGATGFSQETVLANNLSLSEGEAAACAVFEPTPGEIWVALCTNIGGELVFYDAIQMPPIPTGSGFVIEPTPFVQNWANTDNPAANVSEVQFNGIDGDLSVTTYPDNFKGYDGRAIPGSVSPYTRSARFEKLTNYNASDGVSVVDGTYKLLTFTSGIVSTRVYTQSATLLTLGQGPVGAMVRINTLTATPTTGYYFGFTALNRDNSRVEFYMDGADLRFRSIINSVQTDELVRAGWVPAMGHVLAIFVDTTGGTVSGLLGIGPTIYASAPMAYDDIFAGTAYLPRAGHLNVPAGESFTMACQYKAADMDPDIVAAVLTSIASFKDLEGTVVS